jgi:hypothetical protein
VAVFAVLPTTMQNLISKRRLLAQGIRLFHGRRWSFFSVLLLAAALLSAGCATRQTMEAPVPASAPAMEKKLDVTDAARSNIGVRYKYGGNSPQTGFDCSGLVCWSYEQVGVSLPRRARDQLMFGIQVGKNELQPGDIVVFKGTNNRSGWHAGIYTGDGKFIHSRSTGKTVKESSLDQAYYVKHYAGARRIPRDGNAAKLHAEYMEKERAAANSARSGKKAVNKKTAVAQAKTKSKPATEKKRNGADNKTAQKPMPKASPKMVKS